MAAIACISCTPGTAVTQPSPTPGSRVYLVNTSREEPEIAPTPTVTPNDVEQDIRRARISAIAVFLAGKPLAEHGPSFVAAAEMYGLEWALLPAIAMRESTGGEFRCTGTFNAWGYGSCNGYYPQLNQDWVSAIYFIAAKLTEAPYAGHSDFDKLRIWQSGNTYAASGYKYASEVTDMMATMYDWETATLSGVGAAE